MSTKFVVTSS